MIQNFFKIAVRNLLRNKGFSFINIFGLAVGMASAILILLWIQNEMSIDRFHKHADRIYLANNLDKFNGELWAWGTTPKLLGPTLKLEYAADVEDAVRINERGFLLTVGDKHLNANGYFTDSGFLQMFSFPLVRGNAATSLKGVGNIVITQKLAKKLFGSDDAMGKTITVDNNDHFTVSGVLKDLPNNTAFNFEYLLPWTYLTKLGQDDENRGEIIPSKHIFC